MWREQKKEGGCLDLMNLQLEQRGKRLIAGEVGGGGGGGGNRVTQKG